MLPRALLAAFAVSLTIPAVASATDYSVDATGGHDDCADNACKTFTEVAAKVADGDTVTVKPGVYNEANPVTFTKRVAITGTPFFNYLTDKGGTATAPVLSLQAGGSVTGLIISANASQGSALGLGASTNVNESQLFAAASSASALTIAGNTAAAQSPVAVGLDSVIAVPGQNGTAIDAASATGTAAAALPGPAITITGSHVTAAGGAKPVALHGTVTPGGTSGAIAATFDQSILHGTGPGTVTLDPALLINPAAKGSLAITKSDATGMAGAHSDADVFAGTSYHLKVGSPDIDQGSQATDANAKDVDGGPRQVGAASDLGADEFSNRTPVAALSVSSTSAIPGQDISYDLSKSADQDAALGDSLSYLVSFGDGTGASTPTGTHAYEKPGTYTIRAAVYDSSQALSAVQTATVTVTDGTAPTVSIASPTQNKVFSLKTSKGKPRQIPISGTASDDSGVAKVELSLRRVSVVKKKAKKSKKSKKAKARAAATTCTYLVDGKRKLGTASCKKAPFFVVKLNNGGFAYKTKSDAGLKAGVYEVTARATDAAGNAATSTPVKFTLR